MKPILIALLLASTALAQHTPPTTPDLTVAQCQADAKLWASDAYDIRVAPMKTLLAQQKEMTVCRTQVDKGNTGYDYLNASHRVNLAFFTRTEHYLSRHYGDNWRTQFFFEDNQGKR
jgi:hypothetical protein